MALCFPNPSQNSVKLYSADLLKYTSIEYDLFKYTSIEYDLNDLVTVDKKNN